MGATLSGAVCGAPHIPGSAGGDGRGWSKAPLVMHPCHAILQRRGFLSSVLPASGRRRTHRNAQVASVRVSWRVGPRASGRQTCARNAGVPGRSHGAAVKTPFPRDLHKKRPTAPPLDAEHIGRTLSTMWRCLHSVRSRRKLGVQASSSAAIDLPTSTECEQYPSQSEARRACRASMIRGPLSSAVCISEARASASAGEIGVVRLAGTRPYEARFVDGKLHRAGKGD